MYALVGLRPDEETVVKHFFPVGNARILIVGCGGGRTVIPLLQRGYDVVGVDISQEMIKLAERQTESAGINAQLLVMDAARIADNFQPGSFDVVWFPFHSADYIFPKNNRHSAFKASARLLKPNGLLIFNSHNLFFPRTLKHFFNKHEGRYAVIPSKEGSLWTWVSTPWDADIQLQWLFDETKIIPRYALIPKMKNIRWKERLARITSRLLDKSMYVIARNPKTSSSNLTTQNDS